MKNNEKTFLYIFNSPPPPPSFKKNLPPPLSPAGGGGGGGGGGQFDPPVALPLGLKLGLCTNCLSPQAHCLNDYFFL